MSHEELDNSRDEDDAFCRLALRYLDGETSGEENGVLREMLATSFERRELFVALCQQQGALAEIGATLESSADFVSGDTGELERVTASVTLPLSARAATWPLWIAGGIVALAVAMVAAMFFAGPTQPVLTSGSADPYLAPQYIATLTVAENCRWAAGDLPTFAGARLVAGRLLLEAGLAEVKFDSGARVLLSGPTELVLQSDMGGQLIRGELVVQAPPRAKGFSIQTTAGTIVDQGTSFGVAADPQGAVEVHVLDGAVELETLGAQGTGSVLREPLVEGEARRADSRQSWSETTFDAARFAPAPPMAERGMPESLVSFWNFDEEGGPLPDLRGENDGQLKGAATRAAGLVGRGSIEFHNGVGERVIVGPGGDSLRFTRGITVEAVFVSRWTGAALDYDEIFRKEDGHRRVLLALQNDRYAEYSYPAFTPGPVLAFGLNVGGKYTELDMPLDGQEGRPTVAELADGRPHHVVATYDAATGLKAIYLDGRLRHSVQLTGEIDSGGPADAVIGNIESNRETFHGLIDEVALYRAALDAATIARHWEHVQAGRGYFEEPR